MPMLTFAICGGCLQTMSANVSALSPIALGVTMHVQVLTVHDTARRGRTSTIVVRLLKEKTHQYQVHSIFSSFDHLRSIAVQRLAKSVRVTQLDCQL